MNVDHGNIDHSESQRPGHGDSSGNSAARRSALVIGGGLAGIATSLALARAGWRVTLLEAKRRLGGRTGSFTGSSSTAQAEHSEGVASERERIDYCQHVGMGCCTNLKQLIDWLDQRSMWQEYDSLNFYSSDGQYQRLTACNWLPAPLHLSPWLWHWPNLTLIDRWAIARGMLKIRRLRMNSTLDDQSAADWLRGQRQTPNAMANFWNTIIVSALGEQLENVSLGAVCKVLQDGFLNHSKAFHLLVPQRPLDELFNVQVENALRRAGVDVKLAAPVASLRWEESQIVAMVSDNLGAGTGGGLTSVGAERAVLATAWQQLPKLAEASENSDLRQIASHARQLAASPITGVHTWWDRPWFPHPHAAIIGRLCQWVFGPPGPSLERTAGDASKLQGPASRLTSVGGTPYYYQIVISSSRSLPPGNPTEVGRRIQEDLKSIFPESADAELLRFKVVTDPQAVFSVVPGSWRHRPSPGRAAERLWIAGDWTQTGWPATMEGAILSGFLAAESMLEDAGQPMRIAARPLNRARGTSPQIADMCPMTPI